jgi:hypothetical protein
MQPHKMKSFGPSPGSIPAATCLQTLTRYLIFFLLGTSGAIFVHPDSLYAQSPPPYNHVVLHAVGPASAPGSPDAQIPLTDISTLEATENITPDITAVADDELLLDVEEPLFFDEPPVDDVVDPNAGTVALDAESDPSSAGVNAFEPSTNEVAEAAALAPQQMFLPLLSVGQADPIEWEEIRAASGITYYVDCASGNDNNGGRSQAEAWKTLGRANRADLKPGDHLLFKRSCAWIGPLEAKWNGTGAQPILIGAYGSGAPPKFQDGYTTNVRINGTYLILQDLHVTLSKPPNPDPNCRNQPRGWKAGFSFGAGAAYNTVRASRATNLTIGVYFDQNSHHNKLLNSTITDNNVVEKLTATSAHGATGVSLHGDANEISRNYFANNRTICTYNGVVESNSIELYKARNSNIHHNRSIGDRVFSELGTDSSYRSENNTFAYNLHVSSYSHSTTGARFLVTRGYGHSYGPILNTTLYNNVVYFTGSGSKGVTCQKCGTGILIMQNNILWADGEPFSSDAALVESHNIFWSSNGDPMLRWHGVSKSATSLVADPRFVDRANNNFRLQATSPAINSGDLSVVVAGYKTDLLGKGIPVGGVVDRGANEYVAP